MNKYYQKAAMFGLDARIALAIFGALSVITGSSLYSAIKQAQVTAMITELQELGKSYDAYLLDTRKQLSISASFVYLQIEKLLSDTVKDWKGPYIN